MSQNISLEDEFAALEESYREIARTLSLAPAQVQRVVAEVSGWSVEHHIAHLSLANELVVRNLRSLLKGAGPFVVEVGEPPAEALAVLAAGKFPRGRAQAPRIVRPPETVNREYLDEWLAGNARDFAELRQKAAQLDACSLKVPHQILGPLSAAQWVRFAATHTRHHLDIAREILAAAS
jgi:hypothetical protein